jgi:hypothetical protein
MLRITYLNTNQSHQINLRNKQVSLDFNIVFHHERASFRRDCN